MIKQILLLLNKFEIQVKIYLFESVFRITWFWFSFFNVQETIHKFKDNKIITNNLKAII